MLVQILIGLVALAIFGTAVLVGAAAIPFETGLLEKATALLTGLFVIAAFVERSLAVLNDIWFGQERETGERTLHNLHQQLAATSHSLEKVEATRSTLLQEMAMRPPAQQASAANALQPISDDLQRLVNQSTSLHSRIEATTIELAAVEGKRDRLRLQLGFAFSVLISAAGVRTLETLLQVSAPELAPAQLWLLRGSDIILTAGVIAGGSSGINAIAELIGSYVEASRRKAVTL